MKWSQKFCTFNEMLEYGRQNYPDNIAMADPVKKRQINYKQLVEAVFSLSAKINSLVDTDGPFAVSVYGENSMEWMLVFLSTVAGNNIIAPINNQIRDPGEIRRLIEMTGTKLIFAAKQHEDLFRRVLSGWPPDSAASAPQVLSLEEACKPILTSAVASPPDAAEGAKPAAGGAKRRMGPDDYAILLYTSGSIKTKGVMHTQKSLLSNQQSAAELLLVAHQNEVFIAGLPLSHAYGLLCGFVPLYYGAIAVYAPTPRSLADYISACSTAFPDKPLLTAGVPELARIMNQKIMRSARGTAGKNAKAGKKIANKIRYTAFLAMRSVNYFTSKNFNLDLSGLFFKAIKEKFGDELKMPIGGGPIDSVTEYGLRSVGIRALSGYGTTEMAPLVAANVPLFDYILTGSVGKAPPGMEITLIDDEVCCRGPNMMIGYLNNEDATNKAMPGDGWYHTGDKGYFVRKRFGGKPVPAGKPLGYIYTEDDNDCFLVLEGRVDNQFANHRGENIFPEVIESLLMNYPLISSCRVYESPPSCVMAQIFPDADALEEKLGKNPDANEVRALIAQIVKQVNLQLQSGCQIDGFELKDADFERNAFGKIKRS